MLNTIQEQHEFYFRKVKTFFKANISGFSCPLESLKDYDAFVGDVDYHANVYALQSLIDDFAYIQHYRDRYGKMPDFSNYPSTDLVETLTNMEFDEMSEGMQINIERAGEENYLVVFSKSCNQYSFTIKAESGKLLAGSKCPKTVAEMLKKVSFFSEEELPQEVDINDCDIMNNIWLKTWIVTEPEGVQFIRDMSLKLKSSDKSYEGESLVHT